MVAPPSKELCVVMVTNRDLLLEDGSIFMRQIGMQSEENKIGDILYGHRCLGCDFVVRPSPGYRLTKL